MKVTLSNHPARRGTITVIVLVLLSLMTIMIAANGRALLQLDKQLRKIEKKQTQRLEDFSTNTPSRLPAK